MSLAQVASGGANAAPPKIDQMQGMIRANGAMMLFNQAKSDYTRVMEQLETEGFTQALSNESVRTRDEYARVIKHPLMNKVHSDIAKQALGLARYNGGIYNKLAQFVASLQAGAGDTGIPREYVEELRACTDQCPPRKLSEFADMICEDLGQPWEELFERIEEPPIGAASLAQVHHAVTKQGRVVALKLQYPGLRDQLASDFAVFRVMSGMLQSWAMGLDLNVLLTEFEATVMRELDFGAEALNGETTRQALGHRYPSVFIPSTIPELSSSRILAMEFVDGMVPLLPVRLRGAGLSVPQVTQLVSDTFAEMACCHGRVHGDPHAGNVYARQMPDSPSGTAQLVMLDHGLVHALDDELRRDVCQLILACASRSRSEISRLGEKFAGPLGRFFPLVLSPWFIFGAPVTLSDIRAAWRRQLPPEVSLKEIGETLVKLYGGGGKTIGLLHSLGYTRGLLNDLGCSERQRLISLVRAARLGLEDERYRPGAAAAQGAPPALGAPLQTTAVPTVPLATRVGMWWVTLQVWFIAFLLMVVGPIARCLESRSGRKRKVSRVGAEPASETAGEPRLPPTEQGLEGEGEAASAGLEPAATSDKEKAGDRPVVGEPMAGETELTEPLSKRQKAEDDGIGCEAADDAESSSQATESKKEQ